MSAVGLPWVKLHVCVFCSVCQAASKTWTDLQGISAACERAKSLRTELDMAAVGEAPMLVDVSTFVFHRFLRKTYVLAMVFNLF